MVCCMPATYSDIIFIHSHPLLPPSSFFFPHSHSHSRAQIALLLLYCSTAVVVVSGHDYDSESSSVVIVDDYDEPIPQVEKPDNIKATDPDDDDGFERDSEKVEKDYGKPEPDDADVDLDDEPEEDDDEDRPKVPRRSKLPQLAVHDEVHSAQQTPRPPRPKPRLKTPKEEHQVEHEEHRPEPKLGPDFGSLLVKVYRGPTKKINEKPFASWGYFVKFPSETGGNSSTVSGGNGSGSSA